MSAVPDRDSAPPQDNPTMFLRKKNPDAPSLPGEARPRPYFKPALIALGLVIVVAGALLRPRSRQWDRGQKEAKKGEEQGRLQFTPPHRGGGGDCGRGGLPRLSGAASPPGA